MPPSLRLNYLIVALVIFASAVIGLAIPVSSGGGLPWGRRPTPVTLLPTPTPTLTPTEAPEPVFAPLPTDTPTPMPSPTATATIAATAPLTTSTALTVTPGVTATMTLTETTAVTLTMPVTVTETPATSATPTADAVSLTIRLQDATQTVRVRGGPDTTYPVVGQARTGDVFAVVGRDEAGIWWQVCCLADGGRGWVRGDLGVVAGATESVPVVEAPPPSAQQ